MKPLLDLVKRFEGCKLKAYRCPAGVWTVGWGSTGPDIAAGTVWTQKQADGRLEEDLTRFVAGVLKTSPILKDHPNKLYAVTSFAYNVGLGAYQSSTLRRRIDVAAWDEAAKEFGKWTKAGGKVLPGLVTRRKAEADLFVMPDK